MSSRKTQINLLLIALVSCFMMAANAQTSCSLCLYPENTNTVYDPNQGACLGFGIATHQGSDNTFSTPFVGDENGFTVNAFRYAGLSGCDFCTLTAYSNTDLTGKSAVITNDQGYGSVGFCAKSFDFNCEPNPEGNEEEEQFEEEEQEE